MKTTNRGHLRAISSMMLKIPGRSDPGDNLPKWTIPASRSNEIFELSTTPGPGTYEPQMHNTRLKPTFPHEKTDYTIQQNDFRDDYMPPSLGADKNMKIGIRPSSKFLPREETPGPGFYEFTSNSLSKQSFTINKRPVRDFSTISPGPGTYSITPTTSQIKLTTLYSMPRNITEFDAQNDNPGPGFYYNEKPKTKTKETLVFGKAIIHLDKTQNPEDAKKYVKKHPELKQIVLEIYDLVKDMPDNPLKVIHDHFASMTPREKFFLPGTKADDYEWLYA